MTFLLSKWGQSLMANRPGWPKLEIRRPQIHALEDFGILRNIADTAIKWENNWLITFQNNLVQTTLLLGPSNLLFSNPVSLVLPKLKCLTMVVNRQSNFSLDKILPSMFPVLEELKIMWLMVDSKTPARYVPQAIKSLNNIKKSMCPSLHTCSLVVPKPAALFRFVEDIPETIPEKIVINVPIVTHLVIKSKTFNLDEFLRYFKFPNLFGISMTITPCLCYTNDQMVYTSSNEANLNCNNPVFLEFVMDEHTPYEDLSINVLKNLIFSFPVKFVKINFKKEDTVEIGSHFSEYRQNPAAKRRSERRARKFKKKLVKKVAPSLERLHNNRYINQFQYSTAIEHKSSLAYILAKGLPNPKSVSDEDIDAGLTSIFKGKCPCATILPHLILEEIVYFIGKSKTVTHLNIEYEDYVKRRFSSELHKLTESTSTKLEQVLLTFKIFQNEKQEGKWKQKLPNVPYIYYSYGDLTEENLTPVQACIDLKNRIRYLDNYNERCLVGNETTQMSSLEKVDETFSGWIHP